MERQSGLAMENSIVLDYHNSLLRKEDITLLDGNCWLNDNIIGFMFEYFENDAYSTRTEEFIFINPSMTQLIKFCGNEAASLLESFDIGHKKLVFFPVNNNSDVAAGGSHWSLLVLNVPEQKCYNYDSSHNMNEYTTKDLFNRLNQSLRASKIGEFKLVQASSPQQINGSDCGMYLICIVEEICKQYSNSKFESKDLESIITPQFVKKRREDIKKLIQQLSKKD